MILGKDSPVGSIAVRYGEAIPLFEDMGIDYSGAGRSSLEEACRQARVPLRRVLDRLEAIQGEGRSKVPEVDWESKGFSEILDHILEKHHAFTRSQLERLTLSASRAVRAQGTAHPELFRVENALRDLRSGMEGHMDHEEKVVFPYIRNMERMGREGKTPANPFSALPEGGHPLHDLRWEHEAAAEQWMELRRLTGDYTTPADAGRDLKDLYRGLRGLELDMHLHLHLENNLLFPKAAGMGWLD